MYAVIETGGKQYRVEVGTELEVDLLDAASGDSVAFDRVLLVADGDAASIGRPVVANASVSGEILRRDRGEKLISFKYRPKARRRVKKGHRQELSVVRISDIVLDGRSAAAEVAKAEEARRTERQRLEDAARKQAEQDAALAAKLAADKAASDKTTKSSGKSSSGVGTASKADKPAATKPSSRSGKADTTGAGDKPRSAAPKPAARSSAAKSAAPKKTQK
jgi:large subunit ribosomal protein L21